MNEAELDAALREARGLPPLDEAETAWRAQHAQIAAAIAGMPRITAPTGWEERTLARIEAQPARSHRSRWLAGGLALAAAAALLLWLVQRNPAPLPLAVSMRTVSAGQARGHAAVGDRLIVEATGQQMRLYRGTRTLVALCPGHAGCVPRDQGWHLELVLDAPGTLRTVVLTGENIPPSTGSLDDDIRAAVSAGARVESSSSIDVH